MQVLVINSGSSSVKFELFDVDLRQSLLKGEVERIGQSGAPGDHHTAMRAIFEQLANTVLPTGPVDIGAIGHRVVHGGERFTEPVTIDDDVMAGIQELAVLAPVHAKGNVAGIGAARRWLPDVPHVAVFDTTYHQTMPRHAREYALPLQLAREHGIRRYGFHGTSHAYVAERAAVMLGRPLTETNLITLHLGNGASVTAVRGGLSVDTSMGMTPLEGLVMGTRCGDVDPAVPMLLGEITGRSREEVHRLLNFESGLKGLTGESDMREVHRLAEDGNEDAACAMEMFCYRARKYIGAYYAVLGRVDGVVFTAGIGENDAEIRSRICAGLERLGIELDEQLNALTAEQTAVPPGPHAGERFVSRPGTEVAVLVVPTNEELEIARETYECAKEYANHT